jgi:DNA polymerase I
MNHVAFDTETYLIAPGRHAPRLVCASVYDGSGAAGELHARDDARKRFDGLLHDPEVTLITARGAYDMGVMVQAGADMSAVFDLYTSGRMWDVQTWERLYRIAHGTFKMDPQTGKRPSFSLAALVEHHLGETMTGKSGPDVWRLRYRELEGVPVEQYPEAASEYARMDAVYTYRVWRKQMALQEAEADRLTTMGCFQAIVASEWALQLMTAWGVRTDPKAIEQLEASLRTHIEAVRGELQDAGLIRSTGSKNMAVIRKRVLAAYLGAAPTTATGNVSTSRETLEESGDELLALLASVSNDEKLLNTYVPLLRDGTITPLNPLYSIVESARTAARRPNVQNQPRRGGVRECFVPRDGHVWISADYSVAELCALAQILEDRYGASAMADVLRRGQDIHLWFAAQLMDCSYAEAVERKLGKLGKAMATLAKNMRQLAKIGDFGIPGGLGAKSLAHFAKVYGVILSIDEARALRDNWLAAFPEMIFFFADAGRESVLYDHVRHARTGFVRGGCSYTQWCNQQFQHLVAAIGREACLSVAREAYCEPDSALFGTRPVMFIHDEIILSCIADPVRYRAAAARLTAVMVEAAGGLIDTIPVQAEAAVMRRWYKDAEPVFVDGLLVPWEPSPSGLLTTLRERLVEPPEKVAGWDALRNKYGHDSVCRDYINTHWHATMARAA